MKISSEFFGHDLRPHRKKTVEILISSSFLSLQVAFEPENELKAGMNHMDEVIWTLQEETQSEATLFEKFSSLLLEEARDLVPGLTLR